ncbi:hypothetical protein G5714_000008 [Onychostoma macrolepis]|uniref:Uncharacterized protein n=1 Tax=Onychostoma macrolepis TaxID=369639 RepID=A0A7J6DFA8_9TELE|nr:hypothetical protein G5714_000008 [Onychostoma macrolepis]
MNSSAGTWKLFFQKVAGVLEAALSAYSNKNLSDHQPESHVLDAIGEVKVNNFSVAQLTDVNRYRLVPGKAETILASSLQRLPFLS